MTPDFCKRELKRMAVLRGMPENVGEYSPALADIPEPVFHRAVAHAILTRQFFPTVAELRADCDAVAERVARVPEPDRHASTTETPRPLVLKNPFTGEEKSIPITRVWKNDCDVCGDTGWAPFHCPEQPCGRTFEHLPHEWVVKCACWSSNPTLRRKRAESAKYAKAPGRVDG